MNRGADPVEVSADGELMSATSRRTQRRVDVYRSASPSKRVPFRQPGRHASMFAPAPVAERHRAQPAQGTAPLGFAALDPACARLTRGVQQVGEPMACRTHGRGVPVRGWRSRPLLPVLFRSPLLFASALCSTPRRALNFGGTPRVPTPPRQPSRAGRVKAGERSAAKRALTRPSAVARPPPVAPLRVTLPRTPTSGRAERTAGTPKPPHTHSGPGSTPGAPQHLPTLPSGPPRRAPAPGRWGGSPR